MVRLLLRLALPLAALWLSHALAAPPSPPPASTPKPTDAQASVPAQRHDSALKRYTPAAPLEVADWLQSNQNVARIGGWRAYAREAAASPPAASASAASAAAGARP